MSDKLVFDLAEEVDVKPNIFIKKNWLNLIDTNNGNYSSNQAVVETSAISNSGQWLSYREGYLLVPMLLTLGASTASASFLPNAAGTSADHTIGLKNWFGTIIHSFSMDLNGQTAIQQTPFTNIWNSFRLLTTLSWNDVDVMGSTIGFYPDNPLSWSMNTGLGTASGIGVCNNTNYSTNAFSSVVTGVHTAFSSDNGNEGFLKRQQYINYDVNGDNGSATYANTLDTAQTQQLWKSYVSQKVAGSGTTRGMYQVSISAVIYLKHLHSFFESIPLTKGLFMKMTFALNNTTTDFTTTITGAALTTYILNSVTNGVGGVNPIMLASGLANNGAVASLGIGALTYRANISVGAICLDASLRAGGAGEGTGSRSITLFVPAYTFNNVFEKSYLSSPIKTIAYTDIYQYQILAVGAKTGQINQLVSNGIAGLKSVLCVPFYSSDNTETGLPAYLSPFDPAGTGATSPMCLLTNFNVIVSGQQMLYQNQRYSFSSFTDQLYGCNSVNGGQTDGVSSGLISQQGFEMEYCYHYVNCERMLPIEEKVPKSVSIVGQNMSARKVDLLVFCEYGVSMTIDVLTASRV